ncbi:NAD(P)/FAD-dependent oxidoreductase [Shimia abyssi]|uniref:Glycine/D-amino acid oxidase-like deaminating enzyme n=1 Tax=Shimia abyssi TaxID=1662395 RepID=A0A2P8FEI3_9RHOB|nr:FAD-binding oxidoreductase [Shimia abyssi]PSL20109.1 glycine/D-amino acid oxidase-like deaminating enzyme [Shimia abyssi]
MTHTVVRWLPRQRGPAAWNAILPPAEAFRRLEEAITADFVVVGAGFAGLSAARRLRQLQPDADIVVLDATRLAEGAAGRNSGFMIDLPHELTSEDYAGAGDDGAMIALNRHAQGFGRAAVNEYGIARDYFDSVGKVNGAVSDAAHAHNASYAHHLDTLGEPHEMLDSAQMQALTGSAYYQSGLYTPGTVMLQPAGYIRGLGAGLARDGVDIYENSPVLSMTRKGWTWRLKTPKGSVETSRVILTVNGHLESFGFEENRLMQLFLFAVMTPELDADQLTRLGGAPRWGITPSDPMGTTMRRIDTGQGGNRIVTRTCAVLRPNTKVGAGDVKRAARVMQRKFDARFPQLAGLNMEHAWAGHLCLSLNGVSVMGEVDTGLFSGCVQNGLGTARGTLTGIGAAELAVGETSDVTNFFTRQDRPQKLPPQPFREMGANTLLRWREWKARHE